MDFDNRYEQVISLDTPTLRHSHTPTHLPSDTPTLPYSDTSSSFTLIELMVVMLIMAVIALISVPVFTSIGRGYGMRSAVNNVYNNLALARQWAITHKREVEFHYAKDNSFTGSTFCIKDVDGLRISRVITNSMDVNFKDSGYLTFKTDGGLVGDNEEIVIKDRKSDSVTNTIKINALTGGIRVEQ